MKATAVILGTREEQEASGEWVNVVDPEVVDLTEWREGGRGSSPVFRDGSYRVPDDIVGSWDNPRVEDGRLLVDVEIPDAFPVDQVSFSFAGMVGGGQARLIAVHAGWKHGPAEEA